MALSPSGTLLATALLALGPPVVAQTTGVAGTNRLEIFDYTTGVFFSPPPCGAVTSSVSDPALSLKVCSQTAGQTAYLLVGTDSTSAFCAPCAVAFPASPCALPFSTCGGSTNQSLDVLFFPAATQGPFHTGVLGPMGACRRFEPIVYSSLPAPMELIGKRVAIQVVLLNDPCSASTTGSGELFTNAFEVVFTP